MELRKLFTDDDAVSPVIGVILMVAITVILAAVIGAFVLGFGGGGSSQPNVEWDTETWEAGGSPVGVNFTHGGGDDISSYDNIEVADAAGTQDTPFVFAGSDDVIGTNDMIIANDTSGTDPAPRGFGAPNASQSEDFEFNTGDEIDLLWVEGDSSTEMTTHVVN